MKKLDKFIVLLHYYYHHIAKTILTLTRVPLAARIPNGLEQRVVKGPVQTFDIMETFLDLAGIKSEFVRFGKSLMDHMTNPEYDDLSRVVYNF